MTIPCQQLAGGEGDIWVFNMLNESTPFMAYGRGVYGYAAGNLTITNPEDNNLLLANSGSRWFGSLFEPKGMEYWLHYIMEGQFYETTPTNQILRFYTYTMEKVRY